MILTQTWNAPLADKRHSMGGQGSRRAAVRLKRGVVSLTHAAYGDGIATTSPRRLPWRP